MCGDSPACFYMCVFYACISIRRLVDVRRLCHVAVRAFVFMFEFGIVFGFLFLCIACLSLLYAVCSSR